MAAAKQFKFVSPGVFVGEIDNSEIPRQSPRVGPIVIGRAERGPSMRPVKVESFSDFINVFGNPIAGGVGGDVWRDGNKLAPTYGVYAAQAWLKNNSPLTYVRLLGAQHTNNTTAGAAGWDTKNPSGATTTLGTTEASGGAYGLFLIDSGSGDKVAITNGVNSTPQTGALAAIFYLGAGAIALTGSVRDEQATAGTTSGSAVLVKTLGADKELRAVIYNNVGTVVKTTTFNFNRNSEKYIRRVFNTNPTLTNLSISQGANTASYWLGETFERHMETIVTGTAGQSYGVILGLKGDDGTEEGSDHRMGSKAGQTGWFFSQDLASVTGSSNSYQPTSMTKLFKFHCLDTGEWTQRNIKISIQDIRASTNPFDPFGTFTVVLRQAQDSDNAPRIIERYTECSLNPNSLNYIAKKIGDKYVTWSDLDRRYREYGNYDNQSKFVRVQMNQDVDAGAVDSSLLPFGVFGPLRHKGFAIIGGSNAFHTFGASADNSNDFTAAHVQGFGSIVRAKGTGSAVVNTNTGNDQNYTGSFRFPTMQLRSSSAGTALANPQDAYFGLDTSVSTSNTRFDPSYYDLVRALPAGYDIFGSPDAQLEYSWDFTLDDLSSSGVHAVHVSGSRASGTSITASGSTNYKAILDLGFDRFTSPIFGGFDGLDILEKEPFNNTDLNGGSETTNYAFNSVKRAIDSVADPEVVESNIMCMPGITEEPLTSHLIQTCENRGDSLAIIDLKGGFLPDAENNSAPDSTTNKGSISTTISNLEARRIDSSYACAYYPWVQIRDTINGATLWAPPSVAALGAMAYSEKKEELWFAPAGFTRGGLSDGAAGIPVIGVRERLTSTDRDNLYQANINPIASFPNEGIVIFGQKTLKLVPSALDRINVRRLLIYLKKEISRMAASILFDQNVRQTWNRFLSKVKPFMRSVQTRFGLTDFRVILDESTTTPDLIDRNILYAKILIKPARAIEFIALDFVVTDSGASFED